MDEKQRMRAMRLKTLGNTTLGKTAGHTRRVSNQSSPPKPSPTKSSTWNCPKCTYINTKPQCEMCEYIES